MKHVYERTGKFHYEQMASLISAAMDSQIDAVALRMWCSKQGLTKPKRNPAVPKSKLSRRKFASGNSRHQER
jgi:hypothetical protein